MLINSQVSVTAKIGNLGYLELASAIKVDKISVCATALISKAKDRFAKLLMKAAIKPPVSPKALALQKTKMFPVLNGTSPQIVRIAKLVSSAAAPKISAERCFCFNDRTFFPLSQKSQTHVVPHLSDVLCEL